MRPTILGLTALVIISAALFAANNSGSASVAEPPVVDRASVPGPGPVFAENRIVARFRADAAPAAIQALNSAHGASVVKSYALSAMQLLELPAGANIDAVVAAYSRSPLVLEAGRSRIARALDGPNDSNYSYQWHMHDTPSGIRVEPAWLASGNQGAGVVVAVIDTGVAYESFSRPATPGLPAMNFVQAPDLAGVPFVSPKNYVNDDTHANDDNGHGSHVTGTIAQATNNAYGVVGVAYNSTIMPIKVLDWSGAGMDADLVDSIYYAVNQGAQVISMSLGFTGTGTPDANGTYCTEIVGLNAALDYAYSNGVVVVAAAGNDGGTVSCPGAYQTVISVGATRFDAQVTYYSNHGAALDVAAPGGDPNVDQNGDGFSDGVIQETFCSQTSLLILIAILSGTPAEFNEFCDVLMSGTSMATPHVSGIAALLLGKSPSLSPDAVRAIIQGSARDYGAAGWDEWYGWGLVDAAAAVQTLSGAPTPTATATSTPSSPTATPTAIATSTATPAPSATPTPGSVDSVQVNRAQYNSRKAELVIEATSSGAPSAVLTVYDNTNSESPALLGTLSYNSKKKVYSGTFTVAAKPSVVLVTSSLGGSATSAVSGH